MTKKVKPVQDARRDTIQGRLAGILIDALMHKFTWNGVEANNILFLECANLINLALYAGANEDLSAAESTMPSERLEDYNRHAYSPIELPKSILEGLEEGESFPHLTFRIEAVRESEESRQKLEAASEVLEDFLRRDEAEMETAE